MFELKGSRPAIEDLHVIVESRYVLFADGDNDMLYTGVNRYGNRVLGVIVAEDDDTGMVRYLHVIVTEEQYRDFLKRKVSLMEILQLRENFFVVDFNQKGQIVDHTWASLSDLPVEYHPGRNSYCPDFVSDPTQDFDVNEGKRF